MWLPIAIDWNSMFSFNRLLAVVVSGLAGIVGIFLGAMLTGLALTVIWPLFTSRRLPRPVAWLIRLAGGVACGVLVFFYVMLFFGGPGTGGPGGWGYGTGEGENGKKGEKDAVVVKDEGKEKSVQVPPTTLYVEVLTDMEITKAADEKAVEDRKYYRIEGADKAELMTLGELLDRIDRSDPAVKELHLVLGPYRSDPKVPRVSDLKNEAVRRGITVKP